MMIEDYTDREIALASFRALEQIGIVDYYSLQNSSSMNRIHIYPHKDFNVIMMKIAHITHPPQTRIRGATMLYQTIEEM
jgi:hypothetical protein